MKRLITIFLSIVLFIPLVYARRIRKHEVIDTVNITNEFMRFAGNIHQFNSEFPQEKVYLQFDNTAYFQGEVIWFKAFVTHATTLGRAPSKVLYVDFLAPTGQLLSQQKLKIVAGQADGAIALLDGGTWQTRDKRGVVAYPSGFYEVRAYTQNMMDFSREAIFSRVLPVYTQPRFLGEYDKSHVVSEYDNTINPNLRGEPVEMSQNFDVTFYPEGGDLVKGLPCRVAFKATGSDAFGIEGTIIIPGQNDSVFTVHDGMGSFIITPTGTETVYFIPRDGKQKRFSLPKTVRSGYSMISDICSDSVIQVSIRRTPDRIGEQTALAVTCRGEIIHFEEIFDSVSSNLNIDCSGWPLGVCRMTLYNKKGQILSSRSIFHNNEKFRSPAIAVRTDSMSRNSFSKEVVRFKLTDREGNPLRDRFCLSVRDAKDYGGGHTDNLQTNLLLSSDLRGYIHDPAWYLEANDAEHREALNLLTLVQGWERYEWQYMTGLKKFEEKHRVEDSLTMNGWILSYGRREPVSGIGVYATVMPNEDKKLFESFEYHTDSTGYFGFDMSDFYGKGKFTINLMSAKRNGQYKYNTGKRIRFERADRPAPRLLLKQEMDLSRNKPKIDDYKVDFTDDGLTPEQRKKLGRMIDDVDIEEYAEKRRFIDYFTFSSFDTDQDAEMELDMGEYTTNVEGYFKERGIEFCTGNMPDEPIFGDLKIRFLKPCFYVHNQTQLLSESPFAVPPHTQIDMIDVKSIIVYDEPLTMWEILDVAPMLRRTVDGGWDKYTLVDIQIKEPQELLFAWEIRNLGRRVTNVVGFSRPVEFYSPQYPEGPIAGEIDPRRTLYWNANVVTDDEGCARVEFYNNSFTHNFTISGAGITASGIPYVLNQTW